MSCLSYAYILHGYFATSPDQVAALVKSHVYACRAALHADWGHAERADDFATMAATLAFLAFPDLRHDKWEVAA